MFFFFPAAHHPPETGRLKELGQLTTKRQLKWWVKKCDLSFHFSGAWRKPLPDDIFVRRMWRGFNLHAQNFIWSCFKESRFWRPVKLRSGQLFWKIPKIIHLADFFRTVFDSVDFVYCDCLAFSKFFLCFLGKQISGYFFVYEPKISLTCFTFDAEKI